jgi:hypothetical protein
VDSLEEPVAEVDGLVAVVEVELRCVVEFDLGDRPDVQEGVELEQLVEDAIAFISIECLLFLDLFDVKHHLLLHVCAIGMVDDFELGRRHRVHVDEQVVDVAHRLLELNLLWLLQVLKELQVLLLGKGLDHDPLASFQKLTLANSFAVLVQIGGKSFARLHV